MQVRLWLQAGKRDIAVVAQDRVVARRMRALLERAEVLVADETGWTFATLSVSTVLDRWLTALQSDFYHHDLLDLLKSPYHLCRHDCRRAQVGGVSTRTTAAQTGRGGRAGEIQRAGRTRDRVASAAGASAPGRRVAGAEQEEDRWRNGCAALRESLDVLGIDSGLQQDDAGVQLLARTGDLAAGIGGR